jgi:hypothetical protein
MRPSTNHEADELIRDTIGRFTQIECSDPAIGRTLTSKELVRLLVIKADKPT